MLVTTTSVVADRGRSNEDFVGAVPACGGRRRRRLHSRRRGGLPARRGLVRAPAGWHPARPAGRAGDETLAALLAAAIEQVTDEHRPTCDPAHPWSPWAAVAVVRVRTGRVEHLVLGDATVVLDRVDGAAAGGHRPPRGGDQRVVRAGPGRGRATTSSAAGCSPHCAPAETTRGGFWVAKDDPRAADEAVTGRRRSASVRAAALLSNGASRVVDRFGLTDWAGVLAELAASGPADVVAAGARGGAAAGGGAGRRDHRLLHRPRPAP